MQIPNRTVLSSTSFLFQARPSLHLTHVAFSPNGEEVLLNYSGEHIYLMDVAQGALHFFMYVCGQFCCCNRLYSY